MLPCPAVSLHHELQCVCDPYHCGMQQYLLTQTYGCHFSISKRNMLKNALKLVFTSFICRNRKTKPFLSLSVVFKKRSSLLVCTFTVLFSHQPYSVLLQLVMGSSISHLPVTPVSLLPPHTPSLLGHGAGPSYPLLLSCVYRNIDLTVCMLCEQNQYFSRLSRVCSSVMEPSLLM